ncbi:MipA/OmpV family protein [Pseudoalteromonas xiamenensis]
MIQKYLLLVLSAFFSVAGFANQSDATQQEPQDGAFSWQLSFGVYGINMTMPKLAGDDSQYEGLTILSDVTIEYQNFYLDSKTGDFYGGSDIGYQLIVEPDWGVDVIYGNYQLEFDEYGYFEKDDVIPELKGIKKRRQDQSFGLSYYRTYGNFQTSLELVYDVFGPTNGWVAHAEATRNFELRNWDLWLNFGLNYYSSRFHNYYYGVSEEEATSFRPEHDAGDATSVFLQFELNRAISDSWVFSSGASFIIGDSSIKRSPIVETNYARVFFMGVKYVF